MSLGRFKITYSVQMLSEIHEELNEEPFSREKKNQKCEQFTFQN